ncbi:hypothetical protein ACFSCX_03480 [Bacillus salitolerans]|uniref:Short-chain dehydrogenase n=1 Tax=Bacillus salitolerans TaxID=1437434 RepID=A0ABW4LK75_9BACI
MTMLDIVLAVLGTIILITGLFYTFNISKNTKYQTNGYDTEVNPKVQDHPYTRNPIFLTYIIAGVLIIGYIIFRALTSQW